MEDIFSGGRFPSPGGFDRRLPSGDYVGSDYRHLAGKIIRSARKYVRGIENASGTRHVPNRDVAVFIVAGRYTGEIDSEILDFDLKNLGAEAFWRNYSKVQKTLKKISSKRNAK